MSDWSNLADEARDESRGPGPGCSVQNLLNSLPAEESADFEKVLNDPTVTHTGLSRALRRRLGAVAPSLFSVGNHRRGNCRCNA